MAFNKDWSPVLHQIKIAVVKKNIILILLVMLTKFASALDLHVGRWNNLQVKIDGRTAILSIFIFGPYDVRGNYAYNDVKIPVTGKIQGSTVYLKDKNLNVLSFIVKKSENVQVYQFNSIFDGYFFDAKHAKKLNTTYNLFDISDGENSHRYVRFEMPESKVEEFAKKTKTAIVNRDKAWLSANCKYPLLAVEAPGEFVNVRNKEQFLAQFDLIFPSESLQVAKNWRTVNMKYRFLEGLSLGMPMSITNVQIDSYTPSENTPEELFIKLINFYQ